MPQAILVMQVVSAAAAAASAQQQAKAQNKAAWDNYNIQKNQLEQEAIQSSNQASMEQSERAKQLIIEQAKITTLASESGVSGNSVDALLQDSYMQAGIDMSISEGNRLNRGLNNNSQLRSSYARASATSQDAANKASSAMVGAGLQIAGSTAGYIDKYGSLSSTTPKKT